MTVAAQRSTDHRLLLLARVLTGVAVLSQVAYPLLDGDPSAATNPPLVVVTAVSVVTFCAASVTSAAATWGARAAAVLVAVGGGLGLLAEAVGMASGYPFGSYTYTGTLGPQLLGVPLLVPLAWVMMAYPCLLAGRTVASGLPRPWPRRPHRLPGSRRRRPHRLPGLRHDVVAVAAAAWLLAAWDLFLDPQMVTAGHWRWTFPQPSLPGVEGVPLTNFAGWLLVAVVIQAALHAALPDRGPGDTAVPAVLLGWTWLGSSLANLVFFDRPAVAAYGFVAIGVVAAPALLRWVRR
ncbi:MAG: carotenoid biosynthesis protein [Actinomycetes bacterium]